MGGQASVSRSHPGTGSVCPTKASYQLFLGAASNFSTLSLGTSSEMDSSESFTEINSSLVST